VEADAAAQATSCPSLAQTLAAATSAYILPSTSVGGHGQARAGAHFVPDHCGFGVGRGVHRSADTGEQHAITGSCATDFDAIEDEPSDGRNASSCAPPSRQPLAAARLPLALLI